MHSLTPWAGLVAILLIVTGVQADSIRSICCQKLTQAGVIPQVLDQCPEQILTVQYPYLAVNCGEELRPGQTVETPEVSWKADPYEFYALMIIDPDAPSRSNPTAAEFLHWLVVNIPGKNIEAGEVLETYKGPTPPAGTGLHRYTFLLYRQPEKIVFNEPRNRPRPNFDHTAFAMKYYLGEPVATFFFVAQDDSA